MFATHFYTARMRAGVLYWGFTNVDEILHTGKTASAPGIWLLAQLAAAKFVATALCKGFGLVGGLYAPSLMIGAAVGAVFGGSAGELINSAILGNAAIAQPQTYALVGMAATLASVCSVPLTLVLLLFELTKDYRILLPLMEFLMRMTLDSICKVGFGVEIGILAPHLPENCFAQAFDTANTIVTLRFIDPLWKIKKFLNLGLEVVLAQTVTYWYSLVYFVDVIKFTIQYSSNLY